jgi:arsenate reductase
MNKNILFHNPNCSKSRGALDIISQKELDVEVIEYLKDPPSEQELEQICNKLKIKPLQLIRTADQLFSELGLAADDQRPDSEWFAIMHNNPSLIERPILVYNGQAAIGRPPEKILEII